MWFVSSTLSANSPGEFISTTCAGPFSSREAAMRHVQVSGGDYPYFIFGPCAATDKIVRLPAMVSVESI